MIAGLCVLVLMASQVDPVGDAPPLLDAPPAATATAPPPTTATTTAPRKPVIVVAPTAALAVSAERATALNAALRASLSAQWQVIDGAALTPSELMGLETCAGIACATPLHAVGAEAALLSTLAPLAKRLSLTVTLKRDSSSARATAETDNDAADLAPLVDEALAKARATTMSTLPTPSAPTTPEKPTTTPAEAPTEAPTVAPTTVSPFATSGDGSSPPIVMLVISYAASLIPVAGSPFLLPMVQGLLLSELGPELVNISYPDWWMGTAAGYAAYIVGFGVGAGLYVTGVITTINNPPLGLGLVVTGAAAIVVTAALEPLIFYAVASTNAAPAATPDVDQGAPSTTLNFRVPLGVE